MIRVLPSAGLSSTEWSTLTELCVAAFDEPWDDYWDNIGPGVHVLVEDRVLRKHPRMNASWENGRIALHQDINVGLAIAVENAVVATVVHKADQASIGDIAKQRIDKASRARANKLQPSDISGATFTISNLGMFNVDTFTAIIVPPQVGILAVGAIVDRVVVVEGMLAVKPMMTVTLSSDHRVIDGANAARFLNDVVVAIGEAGKFS